jgi:cytoskeletal protein CcmA (bactofilin family)
MSDEQKSTTTTIGPTIVIRGRLTSDEDLVVKGRIDAVITSTKALMIEDSGIVKANVQVRSVRVNGILVGNINASDKAEIAAGGRVVGDIRAPKLVIADGAAFRGSVDMPTFEEGRMPRATARPTSAAAPAAEAEVPVHEPAHRSMVQPAGQVAPATSGAPVATAAPVSAAAPAPVAAVQGGDSSPLRSPRNDGGRRGRF